MKKQLKRRLISSAVILALLAGAAAIVWTIGKAGGDESGSFLPEHIENAGPSDIEIIEPEITPENARAVLNSIAQPDEFLWIVKTELTSGDEIRTEYHLYIRLGEYYKVETYNLSLTAVSVRVGGGGRVAVSDLSGGLFEGPDTGEFTPEAQAGMPGPGVVDTLLARGLTAAKTVSIDGRLALELTWSEGFREERCWVSMEGRMILQSEIYEDSKRVYYSTTLALSVGPQNIDYVKDINSHAADIGALYAEYAAQR